MRSFPLFALLALSAGAQTSLPSLQNLITNSPFGSAAQASAPAANTPLEFRGTFVDSGERFFSILDTSSRRAEWVSMNESGRPFVVKSYNPDNESIVLDFQGRTMDLKLHTARVSAMPVAPTPVPNAAAQQPNGGPPRPAVNTPTTTEAQRLAQVAEEIRRRRALRQQAQQQQVNQAMNPSVGPQPAPQPQNQNSSNVPPQPR